MSFTSSIKFFIKCGAVFAFAFCFVSDAHAQRGFRIGNVLQAGGGQGFRLGGQRAGMQFGGGQGAIIGTQNFGMRFGNGQGARFGGANFGMQFGGQQGTQIGRLAPQANVPTRPFGYGAAQPRSVAQADAQGQPLVERRTYAIPGQSPLIPTVVAPADDVIQSQAILEVATTPAIKSSLELTPPNSATVDRGNGTQRDLAAATEEAAPELAETTAGTGMKPATEIEIAAPVSNNSNKDGKSVLNKAEVNDATRIAPPASQGSEIK